MGKVFGFLDYEREDCVSVKPKDRVKNFKEFHLLLPKGRQEIQASRCMNCGIPFCQASIKIKKQVIGCPSKNLIPEWNDLLTNGLWDLAYERLGITMPFPEFTGRVCPAPCEVACVCTANGDPVTIKDNELAIIEHAFSSGLVKPRVIEENGFKVGIIGSGPAGLACADELRANGFKVTIFDRDDQPGGLLMYGIPDMKLDKSIIFRRIEIMKGEGIRFEMNYSLDSESQLLELSSRFDKLVIATGATARRTLDIPGLHLKGVMQAMDFLTLNTKSLLRKGRGDTSARNKNVLVIGSGDTSVDCVAVAIRQGARSIKRIERRQRLSKVENNCWPDSPSVFKMDYGIEEVIDNFEDDPRNYQRIAKEFLSDDGNNLSSVKTVKLDYSKIRPVEMQSDQKEFKAELVLLALGFEGAGEELRSLFEFDGKVLKRDEKYRTSYRNVYCCGDCAKGATLVVDAIHDGKRCAWFICEDLGVE